MSRYEISCFESLLAQESKTGWLFCTRCILTQWFPLTQPQWATVCVVDVPTNQKI